MRSSVFYSNSCTTRRRYYLLVALYKNLILYALERMVKVQAVAYKARWTRTCSAKDAIDKNAAVNRPLTNLGQLAGSYMDDYYNGLGGVGL